MSLISWFGWDTELLMLGAQKMLRVCGTPRVEWLQTFAQTYVWNYPQRRHSGNILRRPCGLWCLCPVVLTDWAWPAVVPFVCTYPPPPYASKPRAGCPFSLRGTIPTTAPTITKSRTSVSSSTSLSCFWWLLELRSAGSFSEREGISHASPSFTRGGVRAHKTGSLGKRNATANNRHQGFTLRCSAVAPQLLFNEIAGLETSSWPNLLNYGFPCQPDVIVR